MFSRKLAYGLAMEQGWNWPRSLRCIPSEVLAQHQQNADEGTARMIEIVLNEDSERGVKFAGGA